MLGKIENFVPGEDFNDYVERLEQFFILNDIEEEKKVACLITLLGQETYAILKKLISPVEAKTQGYVELIKVLKDYFKPDLNEIPERYKFHKEDQKSGQSIGDYVVELKSKAATCKFGDFLKEALRDRFVFGVKSTYLRTMLLKERDLTFEKACEQALNWEAAEKENGKLPRKLLCVEGSS